MHVELSSDAHGQLCCVLGEGPKAAHVYAPEAESALAALAHALRSVELEGRGECYWQQAEGQYRWLFKRDGEKTRVVVLWGTGTLTGWESVYWGDWDNRELSADLRSVVEKAIGG